MNRVFRLLFTAAMAAAPIVAIAQNEMPTPPPQMPDGGPGEMMQRPEPQKMTVEQMARMRTDQMDRLLTLTEKQYKKIYKLNLKELREMEADSLFIGRRGGFSGPMGPMGPGGPRPGGPGFGPGGPGFGPGGPGAPDMGSSQGGRMSQEQMEQLRAEREKARLKKDKKLRKILTDEQYGKWIRAEQERLIKMREMGKKRPRQ